MEEAVDLFEVRVFVPGDMLRTIEAALDDIVPRARIRISQGRSGLILHGEVDDQRTLDAALKVVTSYVQSVTNLITVRGSQQVQLAVRIAEVSRSGIKQMGLGFLTNRDWSVGVFPSGSGGLAGAASAYRSRYNGTIPVETSMTETNLKHKYVHHHDHHRIRQPDHRQYNRRYGIGQRDHLPLRHGLPAGCPLP